MPNYFVDYQLYLFPRVLGYVLRDFQVLRRKFVDHLGLLVELLCFLAAEAVRKEPFLYEEPFKFYLGQLMLKNQDLVQFEVQRGNKERRDDHNGLEQTAKIPQGFIEGVAFSEMLFEDVRNIEFDDMEPIGLIMVSIGRS